MKITALSDGWVRTHEEAANLLRYAALGATVVFDPLRRAKTRQAIESTREFTIVLDAAPHHAVNHTDMYSLPCKADRLAARAREICTAGRACLAPLVVGKSES